MVIVFETLTSVIDGQAYQFDLWCNTVSLVLEKATFSKPSVLPVRVRLWENGTMVFTLTGNESVKNGAKPLPASILVIDMGNGKYRLPDNVEALFEVL